MKRPKKILNDPRRATEEMMEGLVLACDGRVAKAVGHGAFFLRQIPEGKVALLVGGGSGHEPIFAGFLGMNLADGAAAGEVFTSPSPQTICEAARAVNRGKGVLFVYGNYSGDTMNFDMAAEMLAAEGIETRTIRVRDDVAVGSPDQPDERRGIAGDVFVIKVAGGAAAELSSLDDVARVAAKAEANTRSMGVAVSPGSLPESGKPTFEIGDDEIEIGMGAHGEKGVRRQTLSTADDIADQMMLPILGDLPYSRGDEVALLINNLGATTMFELLIVNRRVRQILEREGITVHRTLIGSWLTSQEMAGFSISMMRLDAELKHYLDLPSASFGFTSL
ncbi:dihydroxyacetone kinase subunit DhaK [Aestuariivirga sp.]|uniref:dihydroxyacetone kinase subunit DhaK n=1 Tax=Aestuariivirga sp. TaxID=2650926 RepID=UPI00391DF1DD